MSIERIEQRLLTEKYFSKDEVDIVMAVIEDELLGETDRDGINKYIASGSGRIERVNH